VATIKISGYLLLLAVLGTWACAAMSGRPDWTLLGAGAFPDDPAMFGLGQAPLGMDEGMSRKRAIVRGQSELAEQMRVAVEALYEDYYADTAAAGARVEESDFTAAIRGVTDQTLSGAVPVNAHVDREGQTYFVLLRLEYERVLKALEASEQLDETIRSHVRHRKEALFRKLNAKLRERRAAGR